MFRFIAILALVSCVYAGALPDGLEGRIVGGTNTTIEQHSYQVSVQNRNGFHFCGGSFINGQFILTAAHCLQNIRAQDMLIRVGSTFTHEGGELVSVKSFKNHEGYNAKTMTNDIAIIKLSTPVAKKSTVSFIELPSGPTKTGTDAVVTGWGTKCFLVCSSPNYLLEVYVKTLEAKDCSSSPYKYGSSVTDGMVCATEVKADSCQGDSGGPLVAGGKLIGIVSWGKYCGNKSYPGVYTDVSKYPQWVEHAISELNKN